MKKALHSKGTPDVCRVPVECSVEYGWIMDRHRQEDAVGAGGGVRGNARRLQKTALRSHRLRDNAASQGKAENFII